MPPSQAAGLVKTLEGLRSGFARLGMRLAGAGAGILGNLLGPLGALRSSAQGGDEEAERLYQEALTLLRSSGSDTADELLRELGEEGGGESRAAPADAWGEQVAGGAASAAPGEEELRAAAEAQHGAEAAEPREEPGPKKSGRRSRKPEGAAAKRADRQTEAPMKKRGPRRRQKVAAEKPSPKRAGGRGGGRSGKTKERSGERAKRER
ncbi:MAG: hypothetical protein HY900_30835 [Deltaproteobacteria bacterium]|nr:hypothetical protein [Deltaproteobacteria bacterium]